MAESADAEDGDGIAGTSRAVPQGIEGSDAGAEQRRGIERFEIIGN
jgi:hypothetical protein